MSTLGELGRRSFLKIAAALGGRSAVEALPNLAGALDTPQQTSTPATTLQDVSFSSGAKLTIERRGQIVVCEIKNMRPIRAHTLPTYEGADYAICRNVYQRKPVR
jgi:hypothetical protein